MTTLTQSEYEVMDILWSADRDLKRTEILPLVEQKFEKKWKIQTLSTYLAHLVEKGVLRYYREGVHFYYQVLIPRSAYKEYETNRFLDFWYDSSVKDLLSGLVSTTKIDDEEREKIERLLNELDN